MTTTRLVKVRCLALVAALRSRRSSAPDAPREAAGRPDPLRCARIPVRRRVLFGVIVFLVAALSSALCIDRMTLMQKHAIERRGVALALAQLEQINDQARKSAELARDLPGQPCADVVLRLRENRQSNPFVRSVNLTTEDDRLYCSSVLGETNDQIVPRDYVDGRLLLLAGNLVTPRSPLLVQRTLAPHGRVLVAVDGKHLRNALKYASHGKRLVLNVGNQWLDANGIIPPPAADRLSSDIVARSGNYPISVYADDPRMDTWFTRMSRQSWQFVFCLIIAFSAVFWFDRWARSPRLRRKVLRDALRRGEFVPYLQPLVDPGNGSWMGVEVLMRWKHPVDGLIAPDRFIPEAEHAGTIIPMMRQLMRSVSEALHDVSLPRGFHIGFNITASHLQEATLFRDCSDFLSAFPPGQVDLVLELTERELLVADAKISAVVTRLRQMGVKIAIDDFGIGHSNLSRLNELDVDTLKIDKSIVDTIGAPGSDNPILDSIIQLAHKLDVEVVAEGVETRSQQRYLLEKHVDVLQGYLFSKPMPMHDFIRAMSHTGDASDTHARHAAGT